MRLSFEVCGTCPYCEELPLLDDRGSIIYSCAQIQEDNKNIGEKWGEGYNFNDVDPPDGCPRKEEHAALQVNM